MSALGLFVNVELVEIEVKSKLSDDGRNVQYPHVAANAGVTLFDVGFFLGEKLLFGNDLLIRNVLRDRKRIGRDHSVVAVSEIGFDHRERLIFDYLAHFLLLKAFSMPGPLRVFASQNLEHIRYAARAEIVQRPSSVFL